jgi:uncharacterized membrane-anchored protein YhcB (DUF1043 family)
MTPWVALLIGLFLGFFAGIVAAALCAGSNDDRFPLYRQPAQPVKSRGPRGR